MPSKAVPIVLRGAGASREILAFRHPLAGLQLIKGTIAPGEPVVAAALRELREEAGAIAEFIATLGTWTNPESSELWHFLLVRPVAELPNYWTHRAPDDGGHDFQFFWHPLGSEPSPEWHPVFRAALAQLRGMLSGTVYSGASSAA